jgi:hypothetical protein
MDVLRRNLPALTAQQQEAVAARGNVLVVAGAGAGKNGIRAVSMRF